MSQFHIVLGNFGEELCALTKKGQPLKFHERHAGNRAAECIAAEVECTQLGQLPKSIAYSQQPSTSGALAWMTGACGWLSAQEGSALPIVPRNPLKSRLREISAVRPRNDAGIPPLGGILLLYISMAEMRPATQPSGESAIQWCVLHIHIPPTSPTTPSHLSVQHYDHQW